MQPVTASNLHTFIPHNCVVHCNQSSPIRSITGAEPRQVESSDGRFEIEIGDT